MTPSTPAAPSPTARASAVLLSAACAPAPAGDRPTPAAGRPPLIGIFPRAEERANGNGHMCFAQTPIVRAIQAAGGVALMLAPTEDAASLQRYIDTLDGFLIPGGGDIDPARYGEERHPACGPQEYVRDAFECALVPRIIAADKPLLGICRGHQLLNVVQGGTLWQDVPSQPASRPAQRADAPLKHDNKQPFDLIAHTVAVAPGTLLHRVVAPAAGTPGDAPCTLPVNSLHHQAVRRIGAGLAVGALAPDGIVEALELPGARFVLSVQWHPEFLWEHDPASFAIFQALVDAARR